jgi:hypothetical protein
MCRTIVGLFVAVLLALALASPTAAHDAGPCGDAGGPGHSDFAQHHVREAVPGPGGHNPGQHQGYSTCNPSANRP